MAVRTPSGKTLPSNLAIIPSEQSWVFHAIYQYAFPHLYSSEVCSRNCLVLTDKDEAEYKSFEALIETTSHFKQLTVMLCTFHGVWMAFKKDLLTLLEDCDVARSMVIICFFLYQLVYTNCINWIYCTNSYLRHQGSGYTSYSCIKHVYLRTSTSTTCRIRYWQMSYRLHSRKDTLHYLWRRLLKHFKSNSTT